MTTRFSSRERREQLVAALLIISVALLFGGASRADVATHAVVRAVAIGVIAWSLIRGDWLPNSRLRGPLLLAALWVLMIGLQLIPLSPPVWGALPHRRAFLEIFRMVGLGNVWRPFTMSPNATLNSFFAAFVPLSVLVALARIRQRDFAVVIACVLAICALSALLGVLQITSHAKWAYFYRITNEGAAVGLFANRNHQALLMAATFPLLATAAAWPGLTSRQRNLNEFGALGASALLVPLILITGSRAGLVLMIIGALSAIALYRSGRPSLSRGRRPQSRRGGGGVLRSRWLALSLTAGLVGLAGLTVVFARAEAVRRLFSEDVSQEIRLRLFGTMLRIGDDFAPWGAGFGTFDPMFRMYEPLTNLSPTYVNHAHNDLLEIYIEGGLLALTLLLAFLVWVGWRSARVWRPGLGKLSMEQLLARCGSIVITMELIASLADYPLRTPAHATLGALAVAMLANSPEAQTFDGR